MHLPALRGLWLCQPGACHGGPRGHARAGLGQPWLPAPVVARGRRAGHARRQRRGSCKGPVRAVRAGPGRLDAGNLPEEKSAGPARLHPDDVAGCHRSSAPRGGGFHMVCRKRHSGSGNAAGRIRCRTAASRSGDAGPGPDRSARRPGQCAGTPGGRRSRGSATTGR